MIFQIQETTNILSSLTQLSPVIAILVACVMYLMWKLNSKETELKDLNTVLRDSEKTSMSTLSQVNNTLEKVADNSERSSDEVIKEIQSLRDYIKEKMK